MNRKHFISSSIILVQILSSVPQVFSSQDIKHTLRVASELRPRFLTRLGENGRYDRYKGFVKDFLEELVNILGYEYEIVLAQDHRPIVVSSRVNFTSGYWDGVIGMLVRNEADLAFGETDVTMERAQVVDFSVPVLTTKFSVLHKHSHETRQTVIYNQWTIFAPFSMAVWIPFTVVAILYLVFLKAHQCRPRSVRFRLIQKLKHSKKFAGIVLIIWTLLLFTSYISNYTAQKVLAASSSTTSKYSGLVDISSQKAIKIGWLARGSVDGFFKNTINELYQKVYIRNIGRDWISSVKEGVNKVLRDDGKFAFILDSLTANYEALLDCTLYTLPQEFGPQRSFSVATPIGSPLRERINQAVLSLSEQGIIEALQLRWFTQVNNRCSLDNIKVWNFATVDASVQEMSPVFIIAVLGLFFATAIGFWEMHLLNRNRKHTAPQAKPPRQQSELLPKFNLEVV
ncbi:putative glutamate receptor [Orchesella cincta]|uniref:Putative glutamate receptor n=1 Tax=Orchesella cincta TaxID=48709 RepID=A0A1D2NLM3_ORCCI|nr:putative glutamate receptor [Orchesella cincta]